MIAEEQLVFTEVRQLSPQWSVTIEDKEGEVALVTERYMKEPPFVIRWPDGSEEEYEDRDQVVDAMLGRLNTQEET